MAQPFIVSIPHKLGKDEATRRLKAGLGSVKNQYSQMIQVNEEIWSGDDPRARKPHAGEEIKRPVFFNGPLFRLAIIIAQ